MKRILFVCLLGIGGLLPQTQVMGCPSSLMRVINSTIEGWVFIVTSDESSGPIKNIEIYNTATQKLIEQTSCSGYECSIDVHSLPSGNYTAKVYTQHSNYTTQFSI